MDKAIKQAVFSEGINENDYYVAVLDGSHCRTMKSFLKGIGEVFKFPSYYGPNLNALNDCLNDLEWLNKPNYVFFITHAKLFLNKETQEIRDHILMLLTMTSQKWANVPNYVGEEEFRKKSEFRVKLLE